jgi:hypothetical protein
MVKDNLANPYVHTNCGLRPNLTRDGGPGEGKKLQENYTLFIENAKGGPIFMVKRLPS